jgi:hypothetical protein
MKSFLILLILVCGITSHLFSQVDRYTTSSWELIFSTSDYSGDKAIRFSPVINIQNSAHFDFSESLGLFTGLNLRNVGFIYDESESVRKKVRTYNLGIPAAIKIGQMNSMFFYAGYELEIPLSYKEKTFVNEAKEDKFNTWFSSRTPGVYHTVMAGVQLPYGANLKFKYYLTQFYDKDYDASDPNGDPIIYPEVNVYYLSLSFMLFRNADIYYIEY